jgi:hypothetical protein
MPEPEPATAPELVNPPSEHDQIEVNLVCSDVPKDQCVFYFVLLQKTFSKWPKMKKLFSSTKRKAYLVKRGDNWEIYISDKKGNPQTSPGQAYHFDGKIVVEHVVKGTTAVAFVPSVYDTYDKHTEYVGANSVREQRDWDLVFLTSPKKVEEMPDSAKILKAQTTKTVALEL